MSAIAPYIDLPFPNFAMDEIADPNRVAPLRETTPVTPVRPVESTAGKVPGEEIPIPVMLELSAAARRLARNRQRNTTPADNAQETDSFNPAAEAERIRNNRSIRELVASLGDYDNQAAQERFANYLRLFENYAPPAAAATDADDSAVAAVRARENGLYASLGFLPADIQLSASSISQRMAVAIDDWLKGTGVFLPSMLGYASSDGFRFAPLTETSRQALRAADILASYDRVRIAQYLREMASLTPDRFMFYDPTGLGALALEQRREFLRRMDELLTQAEIDARAADLQYTFDEEGRLILEDGDLRNDDERRRLAALVDVANNYYAMLRASVEQYGAGVVSGSLA